MITEKLSGLYTKIEDKYFDALDFLDAKGIPVYKYSDFFEKRGIPSLVVTIAIIIAIILLLVLGLTYNVSGVSELTLSLKNADGQALTELDISIADSQGNSLFNGVKNDGESVQLLRPVANGETIHIIAQLEGYQPAALDFTVGQEDSILRLSLEKAFEGIEAKVRVIDGETKTIVTNATIIVNSNTQAYQFDWDQNGLYKKSGVPSGTSLLLKVNAEGYDEYAQTVTFNEGQVREVSLNPSTSGFVGNASVAIDVTNAESELIDLAKVSIYNKESATLLLTGFTSGGRINGTVQAGIPLRIVVQKDGYITYDSENEGGLTIRKSEAQITIQLQEGGQSIHVLVTDEQSGFGLDGATVQIFDAYGTLSNSAKTIATGVDFNGLDSNKILTFTAYKEGYLPARISADAKYTPQITIPLKRVTSTNSARLDIYSIDHAAQSVNGVSVTIYDVNGETQIPYGVPAVETGFAGYANITVETGKTYKLIGNTEMLTGEETTEIAAGAVDKKVYLKMEKKPNIFETHFIDVYGKDIIGAAVIKGLDGTILFDGDLTLGSAFFDAQQKSVVNVQVTTTDGNIFTENVTVQGKDYAEILVYQKGAAELSPEIEFAGIENEAGDTVKGMTPGAFFWAKFAVTFPRAATQGGVHFRTGEDNIPFSESEKIGIYDLSFQGATTEYGQSYTPTPSPGNESVDRANSGTQNQKNKWIEGTLSAPQGTYTIKVKLRAEDFTTGIIQLKYRAWAIAGTDYYRTPTDNDLGTSEQTGAKSALYAATNTQQLTLYEALPECSDSLCLTTNFVDSEETYYDEKGFEAIKGKDYAIETQLTAIDSDYVQVTANTDSNIIFNSTQTGNFAFAVDRTNTAGAISKKTASAAVTLSANSTQKLRFYFVPNATGSATINLSAAGKTSLTKKVTFKVVEEQTLLVELTQSQVLPGRNITVRVTDTGLNGVSTALVKILNKSGEIVKSVEGDGSNGKGQNGYYQITNNLSPGLYTVEVTADKYKSQSVPLLITVQNLLSFPETIEAPIQFGQKTALLTENLTNNSDFTIQSITIQTDSQEKQTAALGESVYTADSGKFKIKVNAPLVLGGGQAQQVQITVTYLGASADTADETASITISGMVEGKFLTKITSTLHMMYNRKLDPTCLLATPASTTLNLLGTQGTTDTAAIELTNNCDTAIYLPFNKNKVKEKTTRSFINLTAEDIDLQPGETKNITITATNLVDRGSAQQQTFGFDVVYDSNALKKVISVNVKTINPLLALSYPPQVTLFLAQPNISEKASAAQPIFVTNISSFPVDNLTFAIDKDYATGSNMKISVEPAATISLLPGQGITPPKAIYAQANSKITEPITARIIISGSMGNLNNRIGYYDSYNNYSNYTNGVTYTGNLGTSANSQYNSSLYSNQLPLSTYSTGASAYYGANTSQVLGIINVTVLYSGYQCLQAHLSSDEGSFFFSVSGGQVGKIISISNTCAEPVRITGAEPATKSKTPNLLGVSTLNSSVILSLQSITVQPGETAKIPLNIFTAVPNIKLENYQIVVDGVSEISQTLITSKPFGINLRSGIDTSAEHIKANKVTVSVCSTTGAPIKEDIMMPKTGANCAENYCDAKEAAAYIANKITTTVNKARSQGYTNKNNGDAFSCQNTEGACTFQEIGMQPEEFDLYLQNDTIGAEVLDRILNNTQTEGANTTPFRETQLSTGFRVEPQMITDFSFLKPLAITGYDRTVFLDRQLTGCGYYRVSIDGVFKAGPDGLETMTPIIAVRALLINGKPRLETSQCTNQINNIANFNPVDKSITAQASQGTWATTIESDQQLTDIAKGIAKARYDSEGRFATGSGNKVSVKLGVLTNAIAKMCVNGQNQKTIELTLDSGQFNASQSAKEAYNKQVIKMASDALNGAFGSNCLTKIGDTFTCISLTDPGGTSNRKLSLASDKIMFSQNKESCVNATIYSNLSEQLNFDISPQNTIKDFVGIRRITISTDDTKNYPTTAINSAKSVSQTENAKTTAVNTTNNQTINATNATPTTNTPTQNKPTSNQPPISSPTTPQTQTPPTGTQTTNTPTTNTTNLKPETGIILEYIVQGGNLQNTTPTDKTITLIRNTTSKEYAYYRNIKICASPTDPTSTNSPSTAYIQANGVQFDVAILNKLHGESNATTKDQRQTITIQTGTLHPEDLVQLLCQNQKLTQTGKDNPYYFTIEWRQDAENPTTLQWGDYVEALKRLGKAESCIISTDQSGVRGTDAGEKAYIEGRKKGLLNYITVCAPTSMACNTVVTGVGGISGAFFDCVVPMTLEYKSDIAAVFGPADNFFNWLGDALGHIPLVGDSIKSAVKTKDTPPTPKSYWTSIAQGGFGGVLKGLLPSKLTRVTSGLPSTGVLDKVIFKEGEKTIKSLAKESAKTYTDALRIELYDTFGNPPTPNLGLDEAISKINAKVEKQITDKLMAASKAQYARNGTKQIGISAYASTAPVSGLEADFAAATTDLDKITASVLSEQVGGQSLIERVAGLKPGLTTASPEIQSINNPKLKNLITQMRSVEDADLKAAIKRNISVRYGAKVSAGNGLAAGEVRDVLRRSLNDIKLKLDSDPAGANKKIVEIMNKVPALNLTPVGATSTVTYPTINLAQLEIEIKTAINAKLSSGTWKVTGKVLDGINPADAELLIRDALKKMPGYSSLTTSQLQPLVKQTVDSLVKSGGAVGNKLVGYNMAPDDFAKVLATGADNSYSTMKGAANLGGATVDELTESIEIHMRNNAGKIIKAEDIERLSAELPKQIKGTNLEDVAKKAKFSMQTKNFIKSFGGAIGCGVLANVLGTAAFNSAITTSTTKIKADTVKAANNNFVFQPGNTYKMVINKYSNDKSAISAQGGMVTFEDITADSADMASNVAKNQNSMLYSDSKTAQGKTAEERSLSVWPIKASAITASAILKRWQYPYNETDTLTHINLLKDKDFEKIIYYYTSSTLMNDKKNDRQITSDEGLAIALALFRLKTDFLPQMEKEAKDINGWLKVTLKQAVDLGADKTGMTKEIAKKLFPGIKDNEATALVTLHGAWQEIAGNLSPTIKLNGQ